MGLFSFKKKRDYERELDEVRQLKNSLQESFSNVKKDITSVGDWIRKFDAQYKRNDQRFLAIERKLSMLRELMKYQISEPKTRSKGRSIVHERVQSSERSNQSFMNVQSLKKISKRLTPAQKKVIALLSLAKKPLTYNTIAKELRISVVTIRRHINDIKRTGLKVNEKMSVHNNRKVFYINESIKKEIMMKVRKK